MTQICPIKRDLISLSKEQQRFCDRWYLENINNTHCKPLTNLPLPKWRFLTFLCDHKELLAHGTDRTDLTKLIPVAKQRGDLSEFGNATQIFASPDALWAMWFALLNRKMKYAGTANGCTRHVDKNGRVFKTYWFSVAYENIIEDMPLADGMVYLVRPDTFLDKNGEEWGSKQMVTPIAKLAVSPEDWPFSDAILGFERERLWNLLDESPGQFPYFDDSQLWRHVPDAYRAKIHSQ